MGLKLITAPANQVLTLAEAKSWLRIAHTDDDAVVTMVQQSAIDYAEAFTGRAFIDQTWDLYVDSFPIGIDLEIKIPKPPLIEVISITYDQTDGTEATVDPGDYYVDTITQPGWVEPQGTLVWPTPIDAINSVRVRFRAGYLSTDSPPVDAVPGDIKIAILATMASSFEHREDITLAPLTQLPAAAERYLRQYRVIRSMA